jgi:hypothetical protein
VEGHVGPGLAQAGHEVGQVVVGPQGGVKKELKELNKRLRALEKVRGGA